MQGLFGIDTTTTDISILNLNGFYPVIETSPDFDLNLYTTSSVWNLVPITGGEGAELAWTPVPKPLPEAKENGSVEVKQASDSEVGTVLAVNFLTSDVLASVASQDLVDRPPTLQVVLDETVVLTDALGEKLDAIDAATTVDEINNIVNPPTGIINIGRGQFGGPLDLNASNYVSFNSVSMLQSETELYAPATSSVVPYQGFPPDDFNSSGAIFATGDYLIQIRETATSRVIAEFEVPLSLDGSNEDIAF
jgi:hypothetical protein